MLKKLIPLTLIAAAFLSINTFAASVISSISVNLLPETVAPEPGEIIGGTVPRVTTSHVSLDSYTFSTTKYYPKSSYYVDVKLVAKDGYTFDIPINVSVKGCTHAEITALSSESISLRCKTYPIYRLLNPKNIEDDGGYAEWDKVTNAAKYNVQIYYLNEDGNQRTASKSTSDKYFDYNEYLDMYGDAYVSVQSIPASNSDTKFMCGSAYVFADSGLVDTTKSPKNFSSFPSVSINKGKKGSTNNSSSSSSSSSRSSRSSSSSAVTFGYSGNVGPGGPGNNADGWAGNGEAWVYLKSGKPLVSQWIEESDGNWYYVGSNGYMVLGWNLINGKWYYMNKSADRKIGSILSGWQLINGKWYYLEPAHNGNYGALYVSCTTPDGYTVDANGAFIQ